MKVHRDLKVAQATAWFTVQRLRECWKVLAGVDKMDGPVEIDEVYFGSKETNKHATKKGTAKKTAVVDIKNRSTNTIRAKPVPETAKARLQHFSETNTKAGAKTHTDENPAYKGLPNHEAVNHSVNEYVRGMAHTNGMESFWTSLKRGYHGTFHHIRETHLHRYVNDSAGWLNVRNMGAIEMIGVLTEGMAGQKLTSETWLVSQLV